MPDIGRNGGVTGILDLPGQGAKISVRCYGFNEEITQQSIVVTGPDTGDWQKVWHYAPGGHVLCAGDIRGDGWPLPATFDDGIAGTLTLTENTGITQTLSVKVRSFTISGNEKKAENPNSLRHFACDAEIIANPTFSGWATGTPQPTNTVTANMSAQTWEGMTKTYDPLGIASQAGRRFVVWNSATWSDAADITYVGGLLASLTAPFTGQVGRVAGVQRLSSKLAVYTIAYGVRTTGEDITMPGSSLFIDPDDLNSRATIATINGTGSTPTGFTCFLTGTETQDLDQTNTLYKVQWGRRGNKAAIEYDGSFVSIDPSGIDSKAAVLTFNGTGSSPGNGLVLRTTTTRTVNSSNTTSLTEWGYNTPAQDIERAGTKMIADAFEARTYHSVTVLADTRSAYDACTAIANTLKTNSTYMSVTIAKPNGSVAVQTVVSRDNGVIGTCIGWGDYIYRPVRYNFDSSTFEVFMAQKVQLSDSLWQAYIAPQRLWESSADIILRKTVMDNGGTSLADAMHWDLLDTVNNATWLGFDANTIQYVGPANSVDLSLATPRNTMMQYRARWSSLGHFDPGACTPGWVHTSCNLASVEVGWVPASTFGWAPSLLSSSDYSVLLT